MLQRQLEPEVMSETVEAECYDQMDHSHVNRCFVDDLIACGELGTDVGDFGTGTALIPVELCERVPHVRVMAIDASIAMLELARYRIEVAGMRDRIQLNHSTIQRSPFANQFFDTIISNSLVHHLAEPQQFFIECARLIRPQGLIFVRDLLRPASGKEVEHLVQLYSGEEDKSAQQLFRQSLHAALSMDEVAELIKSAGLSDENLYATSDRHWTWIQRMPAAS